MHTRNFLSLFCFLPMLLAILPFPISASNGEDPDLLTQKSAATQTTEIQPAVLRFFNRPLVVYRVNALEYSPTVRAKMAEERLNEQIHAGKYQQITTTKTPEGTLFFLDGVFIFSILNGDVVPPYETMDQVVQRTQAQLENVLEKIREQRSIRRNLISGGKVLIGFIFFFLSLLLLFRVHNLVKIRVYALEITFLKRMPKHSLIGLGYRFYIFTLLLRLVFWSLIGLCVYVFLTFAFLQFPYTEPWGDKLGFYIGSMISQLMLSIVDSIPNFFVIMIIVIIVHWLIQIFRNFFQEVEKGTISASWIDPEAARPTSKIMTGILCVVALVMAYPYIPGSNSEAFKGIGVFVGLLISLGASGTVGQIIGGMVLMYSRAMKIGDIVHIGENYGKVLEIGFFSTKLKTTKNEEINIPNSVLMGTITKNYSRLSKTEGLILHTSITIGYDAPWRQVHALLIQAAEKTEGVRKSPAPFVLQKGLRDFYVEYEINAFVEKAENYLKVMTNLHANIQDQFNEYGVQIMSPNFESQPEGKVFVPKEKWFDPPADISERNIQETKLP